MNFEVNKPSIPAAEIIMLFRIDKIPLAFFWITDSFSLINCKRFVSL